MRRWEDRAIPNSGRSTADAEQTQLQCRCTWPHVTNGHPSACHLWPVLSSYFLVYPPRVGEVQGMPVLILFLILFVVLFEQAGWPFGADGPMATRCIVSCHLPIIYHLPSHIIARIRLSVFHGFCGYIAHFPTRNYNRNTTGPPAKRRRSGESVAFSFAAFPPASDDDENLVRRIVRG